MIKMKAQQNEKNIVNFYEKLIIESSLETFNCATYGQ
jgi:hypothetical protein